MKTEEGARAKFPQRLRRALYILVALAVVAGATVYFGNKLALSAPDTPLHTVMRGPLEITVTSPGTIQSSRSEIIRSKAQGRNTVIWIIDEGKTVTNGQLLVELDSSELEKQLTDQQIVVGNAEAALAQSREKLEIQKIERDTNISGAELTLMLAKLDFEKYHEGEYPQQLQDAESKIAVAREELERAEESLGWTKKLASEGFVTRSDLQADELSLRQKEISLASAETAMNLLTNYTARKQQAKLKSDVTQAERNLDRVTRQSSANVAQAETDLAAKEQERQRQQTKLENLHEQVENCKVTATTNGLVIYASTMQASRRRWGGEPLQSGSYVVQRQELVYIPVDGGMIVEFTVTESDLRKLKLGQAATLKIAAMPDKVILGEVSKIGILPDGRNAWLNPDLNLYNCEISLRPDCAESLRAGMGCEVSMLVESYDSVIAVPLQCVLRVHGVPAVFLLDSSGNPVAREIKVGLDNGRMVHVLEGLAIGEKIMLAPPLDAAEVGEDKAPASAADIDGRKKNLFGAGK